MILHPILFALYPVLFLFARNIGSTSFLQVLPALGGAAFIALLAYGVSRLLSREAYSAAIRSSWFLLCFFSYGHVVALFKHSVSLQQRYWLAIWAAVFILGIALLARFRGGRRATRILNGVALALVALQVAGIGYAKARQALARPAAGEGLPRSEVPELTVGTRGRPDVYWIILDRYASNAVLQDLFGYDNSPFTDELERLGFYVAYDSRSNYLRTSHSLASSGSMNYLNALAEKMGRESSDWAPIYALLQDYAAWKGLKSLGYKFIHIGAWYFANRTNRYADENLEADPLSEFTINLYKLTWLYPLASRLSLGAFDYEHNQYRRALRQFQRLAAIARDPAPTFVFAHIMLPHAPYVFDQDGNFVPAAVSDRRSRRDNYTAQLAGANAIVLKTLKTVLRDSRTPPIILLQADEGPFPTDESESDEWFIKWREMSDAARRRKLGILNAWFAPGLDRTKLYPSISPVNTFRLVFDEYFGAKYPLLPDVAYGHEDNFHPYAFFCISPDGAIVD